MPPYRQMFYQFCDLNVEEYVPEGCRGGDPGHSGAEQRDCQGPKQSRLSSSHVRRDLSDGRGLGVSAASPCLALAWHPAAASWVPQGPAPKQPAVLAQSMALGSGLVFLLRGPHWGS